MIFTTRACLFAAIGAMFLCDTQFNRLQAQTPVDGQQLAEEVKSLRTVLFQHIQEQQIERVEALEKELEQVRRDGARIETALANQQREMAEWLNDLQNSELPAEERPQAEAAKRESDAEVARKLQARRERGNQRENELIQRLTREKELLQRFSPGSDASSH